MEGNKSNNKVVCFICAILTVLGLVANIISLVNGSNGIWMISDVIWIVLCILIGYYAFSGYRKPHGNLLKYIILIFVVCNLIGLYPIALFGKPWRVVIRSIIIGLNCYIAGRLHKVKQNIILMIIVTIFILTYMVINYVKGDASIGIVTQLVVWLDIYVAYSLRYKEHKEAGLMDAEKK